MARRPTPPTATGRPKRRRASPETVTGKVRAHDPFELIRWLAFSQPDPRKALAELVQNSFDAGARNVRVTRLREKGATCLRLFDDGEGVIPELDRIEALHYIATHIGHSRKRSLSPQERLALMTQGQYGIGLLGFWSLGQMLEMRSSMPGQRAHRLILHRDRPDFVIEPVRGRLPLDERWTEVVVVDLHRSAQQALIGRRAADYLAAELRGQLLARDVNLVVEDKMSRGTAQKVIKVRPHRYLGERLTGIGPVEVPGYPAIRFEVYLSGDDAREKDRATASGVDDAPGSGDAGSDAAGDAASNAETPRGLAIYAAGTLVAESFHALASFGLDRVPWTDGRLSGFVDFPGFRIAPGSRRNIIVDDAVEAFVRAVAEVEPVLIGLLESLELRRAEELDRTIIRDLQRAFRDFYRQRPRYSMLPVEKADDQGAGPAGIDGAPDGADGNSERMAEPGSAEGSENDGPAEEPPSEFANVTAFLLPPGPLTNIRLTPSPVRIECGGTRRVRALATDPDGRAITDPVTYDWSVSGEVGTLGPSAPGSTLDHSIVLRAANLPAEGKIAVSARSGGYEVSAVAEVEVLDDIGKRSKEGIPEPEFVHQPGAPWRSRMLEGRWQVNSGHREYRAIAEQPALKLRYLAMLFAKEVVLQSHQDVRLELPLEQLVEVAAYADRNLAENRRGRRRRGSKVVAPPDGA